MMMMMGLGARGAGAPVQTLALQRRPHKPTCAFICGDGWGEHREDGPLL